MALLYPGSVHYNIQVIAKSPDTFVKCLFLSSTFARVSYYAMAAVSFFHILCGNLHHLWIRINDCHLRAGLHQAFRHSAAESLAAPVTIAFLPVKSVKFFYHICFLPDLLFSPVFYFATLNLHSPPSSTHTAFSAAIRLILEDASLVPAPACGVKMQFSRPISGLSWGGSSTVASKAAPRISPDSSAA